MLLQNIIYLSDANNLPMTFKMQNGDIWKGVARRGVYTGRNSGGLLYIEPVEGEGEEYLWLQVDAIGSIKCEAEPGILDDIMNIV